MNWEQIYVDYRPIMFEIATRRLRGCADMDADDIVHEVFLSVLAVAPPAEPDVREFLIRLTVDLCVRREDVDLDEAGAVEDTAEIVVRRLNAAEVRYRITRVMAYMTGRQQEITRLRLFEGRAVGEIAELVCTSSSNISQIVIRCLGKLAPVLTQLPAIDGHDLERLHPPRRAG